MKFQVPENMPVEVGMLVYSEFLFAEKLWLISVLMYVALSPFTAEKQLRLTQVVDYYRNPEWH